MSKLAILALVLYPAVTLCSITDDITKEALKQHVDPRLALAIATVESGLNQNAVGSQGEIGLFQLHPAQFRGQRVGILKNNISLGIAHIKYWQQHCPVKANLTYVICYNGGFRHPRYPMLHPYYRKVRGAMAR